MEARKNSSNNMKVFTEEEIAKVNNDFLYPSFVTHGTCIEYTYMHSILIIPPLQYYTLCSITKKRTCGLSSALVLIDECVM
jgi:hypothetical protein